MDRQEAEVVSILMFTTITTHTHTQPWRQGETSLIRLPCFSGALALALASLLFLNYYFARLALA